MPSVDDSGPALKPAEVTIEALAYHAGLGMGTVKLNGRPYVLQALRVEGRTVGLRLTPFDGAKHHEVDFCEEPWRCDCEDATFHPERPGGCKHIVAARQMAQALKGGA